MSGQSGLHSPFAGTREELVFSFDIGTFQCSACIAHLIPGFEPRYTLVNAWPGSEGHGRPVPAIPSIILYETESLKSVAVGLEASDEKYIGVLDDGLYTKVQWFKTLVSVGGSRETMPAGLRVRDCYRDMIQYLFEHAKAYWLDRIVDAERIWDKLKSHFHIVLTHSNDWGVAEQVMLRSATVDTGLMNKDDTKSRLHFLTESEASFHFIRHWSGSVELPKCFAVVNLGGSTIDACVYEVADAAKDLADSMRDLKPFEVINAGGSTVDLVVNRTKDDKPSGIITEASPAQTVEAGSLFISYLMRDYLERKFKGTQFETEDEISFIMDQLDERLVRVFDKSDEDYHFKIGRNTQNFRDLGIMRGRLKLTGSEIEACFAQLVTNTLNIVWNSVRDTKTEVIFITGGVAESPHLLTRLRAEYDSRGISIATVGEYPKEKVVSMGGAIHFAQPRVGARKTKDEYGIVSNRSQTSELSATSGSRPEVVINDKTFYTGGWTSIVPKGQLVKPDELIKGNFFVSRKVTDSFYFRQTVVTFVGSIAATEEHNGWSQDKDGKFLRGFEEAFVIETDLSAVADGVSVSIDVNGEKVKGLDFQLGIRFGGTEISACLIWEVNGVERLQDATVSAIDQNYWSAILML